MATIAGLVVRIAGDTSGLRKEINAAQRQLNTAFGTKGMAFSKGLVKGMAAAGAAMGAMGVKALAEASKLQKVQVAFTNLLGSASKADEYIRKLYDFANQSPFSFEELSMGAQRLMAMGYSGEEALTTLRAIGDAAAGIGKGTEGISRISLALGQIKAKGTVQAEEMRQLAENGIPAWQMLADAMGTDVATAMKLVEKRAVSAQVGIDALTKGMTQKYGGMMEKQAQTIEGGWQVAMDGVQRVLAQTGLEIDKTFDVAKRMRGIGIALSKFSDEIAESGVTGALNELIPPGLQGAIVGVAGAITYTMVPALLGMALTAKAAIIAFAPIAAKLILIGAVVGGIAHVISKGMQEVRASRMQNGVGADSYSSYDTDYYDTTSEDFDLYGGFKEKEKPNTPTPNPNDTAGTAALVAAAQKTSKAINDEWNKMFKHRVEAVDRWYDEEKKALDKSASENATYQTDLTRLNELYAQKRLEAAKEEAEDIRKIRDDVANLSYDSNVLGLSLYDDTGKAEIEQLRLDYEKAIEDVNNKWVEQQNNFISMTNKEKEAYLQALQEKGIAYEVNAKNELSFTEQIEKEKLAISKKYEDERVEYYRQARDVQANIEKAYAMGSLAMLKQALAGENGARLQGYEESKAILDAYQESWREAHMGIKERITNTITETKDGINTFFQDILSYGSSFSESFNTLLSGIGSSILNQVTSAAAGSITNGLMGLFGGGDKEDNQAATTEAAAAATKDFTKGLGLASNVLGNTTGLLGVANAVQGILNTTTKPAEATATITATSALGVLAASALKASFALSTMSTAGGFGFFAKGGLVKAASGGAIYGAGTATSDSIPAMLSNGEYVIRAAAVDKLGVPFLDALNTGNYNGFSVGGLVTPSFEGSGKSVGGDNSKVINVSLNVNAIDASGFEDFLQAGGLDKIKQALFDSDRDFAATAGVW